MAAVAKRVTRNKRAAASRGRLAPGKSARGLDAAQVAIALDSEEIAALVALVRAAGGAPIGAYHEPLGGRALLLASVPLAAVQPTPFQRDLSPTHAKRLAAKIDETAAFLDPLIVVRGEDGRLWTPNGRHRLAAGKVLGLKQITVLISPEESLAYRILALNTEKAHNLKDRSLEVVRMARNLAKRRGRERGAGVRARIRGAGALDARHRLPEVAALRGRRLQRVSEEGRPFQRPDSEREPQRPRGTCRAAHRNRRAGEEPLSRRCRRAASSPRTCATTSSPASTRCAFTRRRRATPVRRCRSPRRSPAWPPPRAALTSARCQTPISPGWRSAQAPPTSVACAVRPHGQASRGAAAR